MTGPLLHSSSSTTSRLMALSSTSNTLAWPEIARLLHLFEQRRMAAPPPGLEQTGGKPGKQLPLARGAGDADFSPIRAAIRLVIARPRPVPPYLRVVETSACSNAWNGFSRCSGVMPMPGVLHLEAQQIAGGERAGDRTLRVTEPLFGELDGVGRVVEQRLA